MSVVWRFRELEFPAVPQELFELVWHPPANIFRSRRHFRPLKAIMLSIVFWNPIPRPRQAAGGKKVDEHQRQCFQVVPA